MRKKILTVDDSKTVRIIVRKAFKSIDCEIIEAANGAEGLAVAGKEKPDLILLDVTMPVMDGVEMLTKLKADPALKGIPVIMLTAEGGRDNVLKIAKIGVRDYVVKPFKEAVLIEKAGRIIDLKPLATGPAKARSIVDPIDVLIVEDKPAIVLQIQEGMKHTPWKFRGVSTASEAVEMCQRQVPDAVIVALSLPEDSAFTLFRSLRANLTTKGTPIFGLVVKTETVAQQQAQTVGFSGVITKPIDMAEIESKIVKALNLDTSQRYFSTDKEFLVLRLPESCSAIVLGEISGPLKAKMTTAVDTGISRAIIDIHELRSLDVSIIRLLVQAIQTYKELAMQFAIVGNPQIIAECLGFEETRCLTFHETMDQAKASLSGAPVQVPVPA